MTLYRLSAETNIGLGHHQRQLKHVHYSLFDVNQSRIRNAEDRMARDFVSNP